MRFLDVILPLLDVPSTLSRYSAHTVSGLFTRSHVPACQGHQGLPHFYPRSTRAFFRESHARFSRCCKIAPQFESSEAMPTGTLVCSGPAPGPKLPFLSLPPGSFLNVSFLITANEFKSLWSEAARIRSGPCLVFRKSWISQHFSIEAAKRMIANTIALMRKNL